MESIIVVVVRSFKIPGLIEQFKIMSEMLRHILILLILSIKFTNQLLNYKRFVMKLSFFLLSFGLKGFTRGSGGKNLKRKKEKERNKKYTPIGKLSSN